MNHPGRFNDYAQAPPSAHQWQQREEAADRSQHAAELARARRSADPDELAHMTPSQRRQHHANTPEADTETASRMTTAQLRDRIEHMTATAARPTPPKSEKPSDRINRAGKIRAYRAELARKEAREAADRTANEAADHSAKAHRKQDPPPDPDALPEFRTQPKAAPAIHLPASERCRAITASGGMCKQVAAVGRGTARPRCATHATAEDLAAAEAAADDAQASEHDTTTQAAECGNCEGTGTVRTIPAPESDAYTARGCGECAGTGAAPASQAPPTHGRPEDDYSNSVAPPRDTAHSPRHRAAKHAAAEATQHRRATVAEIRQATAPAPRRDTTSPAAEIATDATAQAAAIAADPARPPIKHAPDADLMHALTGLLIRYTLGTIIDAAWSAERAMFDARRQVATR